MSVTHRFHKGIRATASPFGFPALSSKVICKNCGRSKAKLCKTFDMFFNKHSRIKPMTLLQTDIKFLKGVGPQRAEALYRAGIRTFEDFLNTFPRRYLDRTVIKSIAALREGETATTKKMA